MKYCDWEEIFEVGITLHKMGLTLQLDPPRLRAVMAAGGVELETFLLDDPLDTGPYRAEVIEMERKLAEDPEACDEDREATFEIRQEAENDLAAYIMAWFFGDISVAFIMNEDRTTDPKAKRWGQKAMKRLVFWSTSDTLRDTLGDSLTDAMRPIYWDNKRRSVGTPGLLVKFCQAGGIAALVGDWVIFCGLYPLQCLDLNTTDNEHLCEAL
jgi:hypothetical protein